MADFAHHPTACLDYESMLTDDPEYWNNRYRGGDFVNREPDLFLVEAEEQYLRPLLSPGSAGIDLAGGAGRQSFWLARQGWQMTLVDFAAEAITHARQRIDRGEEAAVELIECDIASVIDEYIASKRQFGFVLVGFYLDRAVLPKLPRLLTPGGLLLYRTYTTENEPAGNPRGPRDPDFLLRPQELLHCFQDLRILHYRETVWQKGVAEIVAQKAPA